MTAEAAKTSRPANRFAQSAAFAWVIVVLMVASMAWTNFQHLFIRKSYPIVVGWPMRAGHAGAGNPAGGAAFCFGLLAAKIFQEAGKDASL